MHTTPHSHMHDSTIDPDETAKFESMADEWWDLDGKFKPLHQLNPLRLDYIKRHICAHFGCNPADEQPFAGLHILDIGCGGGLLSEPMARLGAHVVGVDGSAKNIKIAQMHAKQSGLEIDYRTTSAESLAEAGEQFDVILNMEVIEHVADIRLFMRACAQLLNDKGLLFFSTLNRTGKSFALAIIGAEYVLGLLPRGTHEWRKFITPAECKDYLALNGLDLQDMVGVRYNPFAAPLNSILGNSILGNNILGMPAGRTWDLSHDLSVNYMGLATRENR